MRLFLIRIKLIRYMLDMSQSNALIFFIFCFDVHSTIQQSDLTLYTAPQKIKYSLPPIPIHDVKKEVYAEQFHFCFEIHIPLECACVESCPLVCRAASFDQFRVRKQATSKILCYIYRVTVSVGMADHHSLLIYGKRDFCVVIWVFLAGGPHIEYLVNFELELEILLFSTLKIIGSQHNYSTPHVLYYIFCIKNSSPFGQTNSLSSLTDCISFGAGRASSPFVWLKTNDKFQLMIFFEAKEIGCTRCYTTFNHFPCGGEGGLSINQNYLCTDELKWLSCAHFFFFEGQIQKNGPATQLPTLSFEVATHVGETNADQIFQTFDLKTPGKKMRNLCRSDSLYPSHPRSIIDSLYSPS
ncbi:hypothetical protein VP01_1781g3 [Puccinia sorghi]|uniref:Uncharacterized protein n=1 Tax=Puccinia sorghi TaxID=27349 RepID=A0A0L6VEQ9_9BASI|nr:hypothetical protein VP01_1781g3 [Puccinia sorghi]